MLQIFRDSFGKYIAIAILALIGVTFVFFGIDFSVTQRSYAAKVNGESIPIREFETELQRTLSQYQRELRIELSDELRIALRQEVINRMVMREVLLQRAHEAGYRISDARLVQEIRNEPAFQAGDQFSPDVYRSLLAAEGYTTTGFEARQREQLALVEFEEGILESSFVTPAEFRRYIELYFEKREIGYALFAAADFADRVEIDEAEVAEFYAANGSRFMTAENVDVEFIVLDLDRVAAEIEISEEELLEYYESESARYASSEERHVRHILITDADREAARAEATRIRERLDAGEDFAALAAEASDDAGTRNSGGDLGWIARGVLGGALEDAVFAMSTDATEGPVESEFGFHVVRVDEIRAGSQPAFETVREEIRDDLARQEAYSEFYDRATDLEDAAFRADTDLASVAESFGLPLETMSGLTQGGGGDRFLDPARFVAAAFDEDAIASGRSSDLIEISDSSVAVLRVTAHRLPEQEPIETVADEIRASLVGERAADLAAESAAGFMASLDAAAIAAGTVDPAELARAAGASWVERQSIERESSAVPAALASVVFAQSRPTPDAVGIARARLSGGDEAIVVVYSASAGVPDDIPAGNREQGREQLVREMAQSEINAFADGARNAAKIRVPDEVLNPDL